MFRGKREVSIHAPLRGATPGDWFRQRPESVSIHAPLRGATSVIYLMTTNHHEFQSTRPCGARPIFHHVRVVPEHVSIHAPLRGATSQAALFLQSFVVSIHAPLRGATPPSLSHSTSERYIEIFADLGELNTFSNRVASPPRSITMQACQLAAPRT